ncbi:MAG: cytochrome c, class I [Pseudomonadota bacterium]
MPRLKDQVGYFLQVEGGREYLVQVPGSATSALNDKDLTAVLNWMVQEFAGESLSSNARPYTEKEVAMLRKTPLKELVKHREALVLSIASELKKVIK